MTTTPEPVKLFARLVVTASDGGGRAAFLLDLLRVLHDEGFGVEHIESGWGLDH